MIVLFFLSFVEVTCVILWYILLVILFKEKVEISYKFEIN